MHRERLTRAVALALVASAASTACSDVPPPGLGGVALWEIDSDPSVVIGLDNENPESALDRVADVTRLSDGSFAIAHGGLESRLAVFSGQGAYLRTIGRSGEGPGEFAWITSIEAGPDDSLYVFDASLQRLSVFASGSLIRTTSHAVSASGNGERLRTVNRLDDDIWVGKGLESPLFGDLHELLQDTVSISVLDGGLAHVQVLERVPGLMSMTFELGAGRVFGSAAFSPEALHATWGRCTFLAHADRPTVSVYATSGTPLTQIQAPGTSRPLDEELRNAWIEDRLRLTDPNEQTAFRSAFQDVPWVDELPYFSQMVVDEWGRLWLQVYEPPQGIGRRWHVLSQTGELLGDALLPTPMKVYQIDEDGILGTIVGDFDVQLVQLLPLDPVPQSGDTPNQCRS